MYNFWFASRKQPAQFKCRLRRSAWIRSAFRNETENVIIMLAVTFLYFDSDHNLMSWNVFLHFDMDRNQFYPSLVRMECMYAGACLCAEVYCTCMRFDLFSIPTWTTIPGGNVRIYLPGWGIKNNTMLTIILLYVPVYHGNARHDWNLIPKNWHAFFPFL